MCGLAGVWTSSYLSTVETGAFQDLLEMAAFRGRDSTGVIAVPEVTGKLKKKGIPVTSMKSMEQASHFLQNKRVDRFLSGVKKSALIGHTRAATVGSVTIENAHPFDFDTLIGVMNGTASVFSLEALDPTLKDEFDTDTELLYALMDRYGIEETLKEIRNMHNAPCCLIFVDKKEQTLNFFRNDTIRGANVTELASDSRPLFFSESEDRKRVFWHSERSLLMAALARRNLKNDPHIKSPLIGDWWRLPLDANDLTEMELTKIPRTKKPVVHASAHTYNNHNTMADWDEGDDWPGMVAASSKPAPKTDERVDTKGPFRFCDWENFAGNSEKFEQCLQNEIGHLKKKLRKHKPSRSWHVQRGAAISTETPPWKEPVSEATGADSGPSSRLFRYYDGSFISRDQFAKLTAGGCHSCGNPLDCDDPDIDTTTSWMHDSNQARPMPVCEECTSLDFVKEFLVDHDKSHTH